MAKMQPKPAGKPRRKMTLAEIRADVERMQRDPKILEMLRKGIEEEERGEGILFEDLKKEIQRRNG